MKAYVWEEETLGAEFHEEAIPAEPAATAAAARERLVEAVADQDEQLMQKYLEGETARRRRRSRRRCGGPRCSSRRCRSCAGRPFKNKGVQPLLDAVVAYLPSPLDLPPVEGKNPKTGEMERRQAKRDEPFSALVFKIMADPFVGQLAFFRVYSGALESGSYIFNSTRGTKERVGRLLRMHANKRRGDQARGGG